MNLLERLKQLEAEATPGPWRPVTDGFGDKWLLFGNEGPVWNENNVTFIAEMRNALPKLLAVVEAARKVRDSDDIEHTGYDGVLCLNELDLALTALEEDV